MKRKKIRSNHNNLLNYFIHDERDLSPAYVASCRKFLKEISDKQQAASSKPQAASNKLDKAWALGYNRTMTSSVKPEFQKGGSRRQHVLDKAVEYILSPKFGTQNAKHAFLVEQVGLSETEYLECLNRATNGGVVEAALWN